MELLYMLDTKILIVEHEAMIAMDLQNRFKFWGYKAPILAFSKKEALEMIHYINPDLVIIDIEFRNKIDGIEIARRITDNYDAAILYLTPYFNEELMKYTRTNKLYGYISKPFEENQLKFKVEETLNTRKIFKSLIASK